MNYFYNEDPVDNSFLSSEESHHCVKVLRKKRGDEIEIINGKGKVFSCVILDENSRKCQFRILSSKKVSTEKDYQIHIAIAPTKNHDRLEWFVEKSCELGIDYLSFISTDRTERKKINLERLNRKAISALKQSKNLFKSQLDKLQRFENFILSKQAASQKFIAFVDHQNPSNLYQLALPKKDVLILIGPEGDFTKEEVDLAMSHGFEKVSLGKSVLRTETAGVIACHTINLIND